MPILNYTYFVFRRKAVDLKQGKVSRLDQTNKICIIDIGATAQYRGRNKTPL